MTGLHFGKTAVLVVRMKELRALRGNPAGMGEALKWDTDPEHSSI